ncbi:MAG: polysaccharide biosynthesis/export family protein [Candidatus Margulisiibacteriota bacterium]
MKKPISVFLIIIFLHSFVIGNWSLAIAGEYFLAPNDILEVRIVGQKDLDTKQAIAPDGTISLPLLGRITAQGQTLNNFNKSLAAEFAQYIKNPQVVVYLTPRPIYVIQHDVRKNTWDVKEAKSVNEAKALAGRSYTGEIKQGDIISVEVSDKPDFWEQNWYKIITGAAILVGIYATLHK